MQKQHWMIRIVRYLSIFFVLFGCFMVFLYTPFYSNMMVKLLNVIVPVEVNQVAAKSQQQASLSTDETLEPGSRLWVARQVYLKLVETALKSKDPQDLSVLQARYQQLQSEIHQMNEAASDQEQKNQPQIPLLISHESSASVVVSDSKNTVDELLALNDESNKVLRAQYEKYLTSHEVKIETEAEQRAVNHQVNQDIAYLNMQNIEEQQDNTKIDATDRPYAIVVLGGGLTLADNQKDIVINKYTRLRLETTLAVEKQFSLPIVLSGVEAPYMQSWLEQRGIKAKLLENRSMNTCENTRFSSLLLQKKGGAPTVLLITDRYHMPRTRRLFALNGIATIPVEAPMPTILTQWRPSQQNYDHSRRANYEMLATIRDMLFGSSGCREVP